MVLVQAFVFLASLSSCFAAKFAMFPMPFGRSHFIFVAKLGQELAERGHELTDEQAEVCRFARNGHNILITGQAGTGKSTVVNAIRNDCKQRGLQVDLICSSGIACQVYERGAASTVHSYYGLGAADMTSQQLVLRSLSDSRVKKRLGDVDVIIWDEISIYTGSSQRYAEGNPYVRFFNDSKSTAMRTQLNQPDTKAMKTVSSVVSLTFLFSAQSYSCDEMLSDTALVNEVSGADVVVGEFIYLCSSLVADKWSLPHVVISAFSLTTAPLAFTFGLPLAPSYVPQFGMHLSDEWSILERARNVLQWMFGYGIYALYLCPVYGTIKAKYNITPEKSIQESLAKVDLIIGQMEFGLEHSRPIYPNIRVVGPFLPGPAQPLPGELEQFMQNSGGNGVILVSFGTVVGELIGMDEKLLNIMAETFSKLQEKVIWKLKLKGNSKLPAVSDNVKLLPWIPQNDILGHPNTRLFIAHAGINGILESSYHGVPMICSPFFGDQFDNAHMAKQAGFAEAIDLDTISSEEFVSLIRNVLNEPSYRESAARISKYVKLLPRPPVKEAADWVEYTQAQGGLQHLRPRGLDMPFYQLYSLDIVLLAFLTLFIIFFVIKMLLKFVISKLSGYSEKEKKN